MQNFDVQHNVACKHSAIGRVANVFSFNCYNGETRCPLFSTLCAAFGSNVGKSCQHVQKHVSSILIQFR